MHWFVCVVGCVTAPWAALQRVRGWRPSPWLVGRLCAVRRGISQPPGSANVAPLTGDNPLRRGSRPSRLGGRHPVMVRSGCDRVAAVAAGRYAGDELDQAGAVAGVARWALDVVRAQDGALGRFEHVGELFGCLGDTSVSQVAEQAREMLCAQRLDHGPVVADRVPNVRVRGQSTLDQDFQGLVEQRSPAVVVAVVSFPQACCCWFLGSLVPWF